MQISIEKLEGVVTGILAVVIVGVFAYLGYVVFFTAPSPERSPTLATVNVDAFAGFTKIQKVAGVVSGSVQKIAIKKKDYLFTESPIYKSFTDEPVEVWPSEKRGRPDPFVPYATP